MSSAYKLEHDFSAAVVKCSADPWKQGDVE